MTISIRIRSIDGFTESRSFKSLAGASKFAQAALGLYPDLSSTYAIADDGVVKLTVRGASLLDLFPALMRLYQRGLRPANSGPCHCESSQVYGGDCVHTLADDESF